MGLETHAQADHLSAATYIKAKTGALIGIGEHIRDVQKIFRPVFAFDDPKTDGSDFDRLFVDGERFALGTLEVEAMHTPGHTPADLTRSEEHTSELQSLMRISYAVFCLKKKITKYTNVITTTPSKLSLQHNKIL